MSSNVVRLVMERATVLLLLTASVVAHKHDGKPSPRSEQDQSFMDQFKYVECRQCVQSLEEGTGSTMMWCPSLAGPSRDYNGVCVGWDQECDDNLFGEGIYSVEACPNDLPSDKRTCSLCVLDGYSWCPNQWSTAIGDEYDGECIGSSSGGEYQGDVSYMGDVTSHSFCARETLTTIAQCNSAPKLSHAVRQTYAHSFGMSGFFWIFFALICVPICAIRCWIRRRMYDQWRSAVALAEANGTPLPPPPFICRRRAGNGVAAAPISVAQPVAVPVAAPLVSAVAQIPTSSVQVEMQALSTSSLQFQPLYPTYQPYTQALRSSLFTPSGYAPVSQ